MGSRFELDFKIAGRVTELTYEVTEYDRPGKVRLFCDAGWFTSDDTIEVAPTAPARAVTYTAIVKMKGLLGLFDPIMQLGFNRAGKQAADGLRETLTRPIVSAHDQGRSAHGRRRLPRAERGDQGRGAHRRQAPRPRAGGPALRLGRAP